MALMQTDRDSLREILDTARIACQDALIALDETPVGDLSNPRQMQACSLQDTAHDLLVSLRRHGLDQFGPQRTYGPRLFDEDLAPVEEQR